MNSIITLPKLTSLLAEAASVDINTAQSFISDLTSMIGEALKADGTVNIKSLGSFSKVVIDNKIKVEFLPDKEISDAINAPFLFFEPVQLADGISTEAIEEIGNNSNNTSEEVFTKISEPEDDELIEETAQDNIDAISEQPEELEEPATVEQPEISEEPTPEEEPEVTEGSDVVEEPEIFEEPTPEEESEVTEESNVVELASNEYEDAAEIAKPFGALEDNVEDFEKSAVAAKAEEQTEIPQNEDAESYQTTTNNDIDDYDQEDVEDEEEGVSKFPWFTISLFFIVGLLVGLGFGYFGHDYIRGRATTNAIIPPETVLEVIPLDTTEDEDTTIVDLSDATEDMVEPQAVESNKNKEVQEIKEEVKEVENSPKVEDKTLAETENDKKAEPVYDVVSPGSDLISLSQKHYKNKEYWVYIYEANKSKIKNPNNVMSGLRLIIPPKSQCDVSTDEAKNIEVAKEKSAQILRQFKK